jgi:hypothetical protein
MLRLLIGVVIIVGAIWFLLGRGGDESGMAQKQQSLETAREAASAAEAAAAAAAAQTDALRDQARQGLLPEEDAGE